MTDEIILNLEEAAQSFVEFKQMDDDITDISITSTYGTDTIVTEEIEDVLVEFGVEFLENFIEVFINDRILDEDMPSDDPKSLEKRKGVKYVIDHLKAIAHESKRTGL